MLRSPTLALISLSLLSSTAWSLEVSAVGPRALGMGGVGVACTDDYAAQYYNPAAFGFFAYGDAAGERVSVDNNNLQRKDWGMGLDATVGAKLVGNLGTYLNDVLQIDVDKLQKIGQTSSTDVSVLKDLTRSLAALSTFDADADAVLVDVNAGFGLRIKHFGIGVRTYAQAVGKLQDLDLTHIGVEMPSGSVAAQINSISVPVNTTPGTYVAGALSSSQQATLQGILQKTGVTTATAQEAVNKLDYAIQQAAIDPAAIDGIISQMQSLVDASGVGSLEFGTNNTKLRLVGLGVCEIPVTYGYALDDHWSIGGSLKYMLGRVYALDVPLFSTAGKNFNDNLHDSEQNYQQSSNIGVDLAVMARFPMVQVGLTGRNLNAPSFKGPTINGTKFADQYLDPAVTAGVAFIPITTVTLAADADLTRSDSELPGRKFQHVAGGIEIDAFRTLALRAGISKNIAEASDPTLYSAGVGLNLYLLRIDLAAQVAKKTVTYEGKDYPQEGRVSFALATDW